MSSKTAKPGAPKSRTAPERSTAQGLFEIALEKVERARLVVRAFEFVNRAVTECNGNFPRYDTEGLNRARTTVYQLELDQWRNLFALVATVQLTPEIQAQVKRLALERFFRKDMAVCDYLHEDFGYPSGWLDSDEEALRAEFAKSAKKVGLDPGEFMR
jgi:hypothetical protein